MIVESGFEYFVLVVILLGIFGFGVGTGWYLNRNIG